MAVFLLFLLATAAGSLSTLFWVPEDDLGRGYFQMNALIILSFLGLAATVIITSPLEPFGTQATLGGAAMALALAGAFGYYGAIWRHRWTAGRWAAALSLIGCLAALVVSGSALMENPTALPYRFPLLVLALVLSSLLLGWSLITMLLGHWYLVAPRLTFRHLTVFCWVLLAIVLVRLGAVGGSLLAAASVDAMANPHPMRLLTSLGGQGMFFWFRIFWGLLIPVILALMSLHCARRRSNQSATGILYVLVVGAFIGEITALYLTLSVGVPL